MSRRMEMLLCNRIEELSQELDRLQQTGQDTNRTCRLLEAALEEYIEYRHTGKAGNLSAAFK